MGRTEGKTWEDASAWARTVPADGLAGEGLGSPCGGSGRRGARHGVRPARGSARVALLPRASGSAECLLWPPHAWGAGSEVSEIFTCNYTHGWQPRQDTLSRPFVWASGWAEWDRKTCGSRRSLAPLLAAHDMGLRFRTQSGSEKGIMCRGFRRMSHRAQHMY